MDLNFLIKHEIIHFFTALPLAIFLWWRFKNWFLILVLFLSIYFVDSDHLVDYFIWAYPNLLRNPLTVEFFEHAPQIFVPFHGWEIVGVLLLLSWKFKKIIFLAVALGLFSHFLVDQFSYQTHIFSYSLIYRLLTGFSHDAFNYLTP